MEMPFFNDGSYSKVEVPETVFGRKYNESLVHQIVTAFRNNARLGTRSQKSRGKVSHTTAKPWRQKGTGRARAGMNSSPIWRSGGRAFPNLPYENFTQKVNKKMYKAGMQSILSELVRTGRLVAIEDFKIETPKTKEFVSKVKTIDTMDAPTVLFICKDIDENLYLASRNVKNVEVVEPRYIDPVSLLFYKKILITKSAIENVKEMFA